ncbi:MAG: response regulator [Planctomycetes bacterium]|nr:response regulator [Planctomycetota bacterium]
MLLKDMTPQLVNRAIEIYMEHAYDDDALREAHMVRFDPESCNGSILCRFEREDAKLKAYHLRLGCQHYPHMKLALWEAYYRDEYVFAVDRHDGFDFNKTGPDYEAWLGIKSRNFVIKDKIEKAWYEEGIPTLRSLKEERMSRSDILRAFSGHRVLVVDNDADAGAIIQMILMSEGYGCRWAGSLKETLELLDDPDFLSSCGMALVDVMLTDGSGMEVIKHLRARPETQQIPIALTSAMSGRDIDMTNADGYLQKPYSAEDLRDLVQLLVRKKYDGHDSLLEDLR